MECIKCGQDFRLLRQDPETSFCEAICPYVPFTDDAACHLVTLFPNPVPVILRQSDDEGELL